MQKQYLNVPFALTKATVFNAAAYKLKQNAGGTSLQKIEPKRERLTINATAFELVGLRPYAMLTCW